MSIRVFPSHIAIFLYIFDYFMELRIFTPSPTLLAPMKRFLALSVAMLALTACSDAATVRYHLQMNTTEQTEVVQLTQETFNVMQRRLEHMEEAILDMKSKNEGSGSVIMTLSTKNKEALDALTDQMVVPFTLEIMAQSEEGQTPDVTVEGHGGFVKTGMTAKDLLWVEADQEPGKDLGRVHLVFTEEGRTKIAALFKRMKGKNIGIFVRGQLVSKLLVEDDVLRDDIVIQDIPSVDLAQIFAEDVNVGIHVTVTPLP